MHFNFDQMSTSLTGADGVFAEIPQGYRPSEPVIVAGWGFSGSEWIICFVYIGTDGNIRQVTGNITYTAIAFNATWFTDFGKYES